MGKNLAFVLCFACFYCGCSSSQNTSDSDKKNTSTPPEITAVKLSTVTVSDSEAFHRLDNAAVGLDFRNYLKPENYREYLLNGGGITSGDYDNDGMVDLYVVSQDGPNKLFRQTAPWKFEDVTTSAGGVQGGEDWDGGASFADINNDGFLDLYLCVTNGANFLYVNQGDGTFVEEAAQRGVNHSGASTMSAFADYDNDGDLDLYLLNNRLFTPQEEAPKPKYITRADGTLEIHPDYVEQYFFIGNKLTKSGQRDLLFRNDNGNFVNVTNEAGISGYDMGLSATWWDYNNDGWSDLYVANDMKTPDHLYHNNGDGTFKDVTASATGHTPWFAMGSDVGDINNDGWMDLLVADMSSTTHYKQKTTMGEMGNSAWFLTHGKPRQFMRNTLLVNSGTQRFWEAANLCGLDSTDWTWSVRFFDCDCDSLVDVFVTNGYGKNINDSDHQRKVKALQEEGKQKEAAELAQSIGPLNEANLHFKNTGDLKFQNVSESWGANHVGVSNACTTVDIDRDGDLDLIVSNLNEPLGVYRNDTTSNQRVLIKLNGSISNRFGVGARIDLQTADGQQTRQLSLARGYMAADEPLVQFGLGAQTVIEKLTVFWPSGMVQSFTDLEAGNLYTVSEPSDLAASDKPPAVEKAVPRFTRLDPKSSINHYHREFPFDDYSKQPLLPNKLSQLGPGIAWGDVNNDGLHDCYVSGAAGQIGALYIRNEAGFERKSGPWENAMAREEMGCLFFDCDADGDQDLYVVSGGFEKPADNAVYQDNLYINNGDSTFTTAENQLPELTDSGSCISACDFDRDGDLDLFVGTRVTPFRWPLPTDSRLLRNDGGQFVEINDETAPGLNQIGLVTSSVWSDADGDGWTDLLLTLEWGPVKFFKNENGKLVDQTEQAGLATNLGWWNSITPADVDHDGDMDFVAMNVGLNTKYHANDEHPVTLFVSDFDGNGRIDLVESEWEGEKCFPIRGKSCSTHAMPMISDKFPTYHEFALADLVEIYGPDLDSAKRFSVNMLESVVLLNDGDGKFEFSKLPRLAQISPGFGTAICDYDGDGHQDIMIAQNFMEPQPETGQMDGGMGLLLKGNGKGEFAPVGPVESGVIIPGQAMGMSIVDVNGDLVPDSVVTVNNESVITLENNGTTAELKQRVAIKLIGEPGNQNGIGARLFVGPESTQTVYEIHAGHGYLTQSANHVFCTVDQTSSPLDVRVDWPDGTSQKEQIDPGNTVTVIKKKQASNP